jgi:hypothetical protein
MTTYRLRLISHLSTFTFLTLIFMAGCFAWKPVRPAAPPDGAEQAESVLRQYFSHLHQGDYQAAVELYGGSYQLLTGFNPDIDPADRETLLQHGCEMNGLACLRVEDVLAVSRTGVGKYTLTVTFLTELRDTFQLGPCCGEDPTGNPPVSEFDFRIEQDENGEYKVVDLPVYVP